MSEENIIELINADIIQRDHVVLTDINLEIKTGEFVYLIGKVGTGKSSLIKTLNAELPLEKGEGKVAGFNLAEIKTRDIPFLRRKLGVVFQDFRLLTDRNVYDNLTFVLKATDWKNEWEIAERVNEVLSMVGMTQKLKSMPHQLSGGEQQRVTIARAILNNPEIILADEPTGNLDPHTSIELMQIFKDLNDQGKTVVIATHDYPLIRKFPARIITVDDHKIYETVLTRKENQG
ncbi:cell division transporter, ATP-binding protein FtsE [Aquipluma nitroreducens]|uniref:Cell division ATP-binding protein FtsE n=1 Tax=Aquipluma nitroreducens TaxID=2010828 RepID=A0A5K7S693_9BACT|nr:ATP-binding cassette domain-containing protein [Aquipluma nitroreducens]BBE17081.1 cell division transporter, ATP-binding protein FtsE [Aquipluma nitroreducens]